jgi:hypothetical protein
VRHVDLLLAEADARLRAGQLVEARALFREAAAEACAASMPDRLAAAVLGIGAGAAGWGVPMWDASHIELLEEAVATAPAEDPVTRSTLLARAWPAVTVNGSDLDDASISAARQHAADAGVADRVRFEVADVTARPEWLGPGGAYDLVFAFEMIHDLARPQAALVTMRRPRRSCRRVPCRGRERRRAIRGADGQPDGAPLLRGQRSALPPGGKG